MLLQIVAIEAYELSVTITIINIIGILPQGS